MNARAIGLALLLRATSTVSHDRRQLLATDMDLWIQPCTRCADLYGKPATEPPHQDLTVTGAGAVKDARIEEHYTCVRCRAVFARILAGSPTRQTWMLLNAGQH
jgi:hypothetical protein